MSRISELNQKIRSQDAGIKTCEYYEDWDGAEIAAEQRRKLVQQKAIVEEYVQAKGQITVFEDASKVSHLEIARCRKRSAILLGSVMQLPLIPAGRVAFPNVFLRSSLFGIWSPKKGSPKLLHQQIPCEKGYEIGYSGPALWQKDFLLMAVLLKMAGENLQAPVKTTLGELRRWMKFHDGKANNEAVMNSLDRLGSGTLRVRKQDDDKVWFDGALVEYQTAVDGQVTAVTFKLNAGWGWLFGSYTPHPAHALFETGLGCPEGLAYPLRRLPQISCRIAPTIRGDGDRSRQHESQIAEQCQLPWECV